ncbi:hypothetical protein BaRGS_00035998, partial [Batillaria attramentaria]
RSWQDDTSCVSCLDSAVTGGQKRSVQIDTPRSVNPPLNLFLRHEIGVKGGGWVSGDSMNYPCIGHSQ